MDGLNNNTINSFDLNYGTSSILGDDLRIQESHNTARVTPLTSPRYSSQECRRINIDRMKDRQIAILMQKNNQLQMDVLAMQHRMSGHYPMMNDYEISEQYSIGNIHLQLKLLTTALDEKSEELKQAKEEHDLIMEERATVHKELREQATEIERLTRQNSYLQSKLSGNNMSVYDLSMNHNEGMASQLRDILKENESMKTQLSHKQRLMQDLTEEKERLCKQLDQVINHCHYLKKSFKQNRLMLDSRFQACTKEKYEILTETIKITDLKIALLNIVMDNSGDSEEENGRKQYGHGKHLKNQPKEHFNSLNLRYEKLVEIDGVEVAEWTDDQILDFLGRYGPSKYVKVKLSRLVGRTGDFQCWKADINLSSVDSFDLFPLWLVRKVDHLSSKDNINEGDILQVQKSSDDQDSVSVIRLTPSPFIIPKEQVDRNISRFNYDCSNESNPLVVPKFNTFSPPVLPMKKRISTDSNTCPRSAVRPVSVYVDQTSSHQSNTSLVSAPPIPPRSSTSLHCSFTEKADSSGISNPDYSELQLNEDALSERLKMSIHSAFTGFVDGDGSLVSNDVMSASFSGIGDYASTKMPKLGKCRNLILGIPSKVFNLKQLGLHIFHSKNDHSPSSKSDVDISVINQIFIKYIESNSSARQAGLFEGDEILSINNQPVSRMTSEEAEHILLTNPLVPNNLKREHKKLSVRIKVQFNPLKMYELTKEHFSSSLESKVQLTRFTRSMYDDSRTGFAAHDKWHSCRLHMIKSSSNLNIYESTDKSLDIVQHILHKTRTVRINMCSVLSQIKIMGGSAIGIFISKIVYRDSESEIIDKNSVGNRLALGDKIVEINGESYQRAVGEETVMSLNKFGHQVTLSVVYEPSGLLEINRDPLCQEHFYMEAMFSFSYIDCKLSPESNKGEKRTSLSTRLDHCGVNLYFMQNYHLNFEKGDILLVDATILPASMTRKLQDNTLGSDWHAWVVDKANNKVRSGMIPSALWLHKMITSSNKSSFYRSFHNDKKSQFYMRSTPNSPKSDINTFLSSNSTNIIPHSCSKPQRHSGLSQKLFRRFSFRNSFHLTATSVDETNKKLPIAKEAAFIPLKRIACNAESKRPLIIIGPHSDTLSMILASKWPQEFTLSKLEDVSNSLLCKGLHKIICPKHITSVVELHQKEIYPIILLLKYKSAKEIRQLKIDKSTQITVSKSDSFKLFSQIKDYESNLCHLINGKISPHSGTESCQEIRDMIMEIQREDIWLQIDKYQYSA